MKILILSVFTIVIFVFSILMNDFLLKYLRNIHKNGGNGEVRWSSDRKPAIGGITFFICFLLAAISLIYTSQGTVFSFMQFYGIMLVLAIGFLAGLFDDAYNTIPWLKLLMQIICGVVLCITGTFIDVFPVIALNYVLTVIWVVGIMNAINLLDNMDGIATIVSIFILIACLLTLLLFDTAPSYYLVIMLGVSASLLAFLKYNLWPAKMYMGDTGSMFLGVLLGVLGILFFWNFKTDTDVYAPLSARVLAVAIVFALPLIDTGTVFFKRLVVKRKSPFIGGKDHTTHHLSYLGLSDRKIAFVFAILAMFNACVGILILKLAYSWNYLFVVIFGILLFLEFAILFYITHKNIDKDETE